MVQIVCSGQFGLDDFDTSQIECRTEFRTYFEQWIKGIANYVYLHRIFVDKIFILNNAPVKPKNYKLQ